MVVEVVAEDAKLWRLTGGHHDEIGIAIAIDVEDRERSAVLIEIEPERARDLVEPAVSIVAQEDVALAAGDRAVNQQLVDRAPRVVVGRAWHACERRMGDDLSPEEPFEIIWIGVLLRLSMPLTM